MGTARKWNKDKFIEKSKEVHGNRYDYSMVDFEKINSPVKIICPTHGVFEQLPSSHILGKGCIMCAGFKKLTTDEFIERIKNIHGEGYDYSTIHYVNMNTPVTLRCLNHGDFITSPSKLLYGTGCPRCKKEQERDDFIRCANIKHNNKYDYSKVDYVNKTEKITIICPIHGDFKVAPKDHLKGVGCQKCSLDSMRNKKRKSQQEFIEQCYHKHGDVYDYSSIVYKGVNEHINVICKKHGEFKILAGNFLSGQGCVKCSNEKMSQDRLMKIDEFTQKARLVHGDVYDYSKVDIKKRCSKVTIICPVHGEFNQRYSSHLEGVGCPKCKMSHLERDIKMYLDKNNIKYEQEKTFEWLKNKSHMFLDFYLPDYNIAIECQGEQHYRDVSKWFKSSGFDNTVRLDILKRKLCMDNNVTMFYFTDKGILNKAEITIPENTFTKKSELLKEIKKLGELK